MKRLLLQSLFLFLAGLASQPLFAAGGEIQLKAFLKGLQTLQAQFRQTIQRLDEDQVYASNGVFYLQRPGKLRWEYGAPNSQVIVADGKRIWLHDLELDQVSHRSQKAALEGTPAQILSDTGALGDRFEIQDQGEDSDGLSWVELRPKEKEAQFVRVRLGLMDDRLRRMEMYDSFGQVTRFFFYGMHRNPRLAPELFVFVPPPAVDIIGDL